LKKTVGGGKFSGTTVGEFDTTHAIDLDKNVFVADRENNQIRKIDASGKFISERKNPG
jgi:hypothetical protein